MTDGVLETRTSYTSDHVIKANKAKQAVSEQLRAKLNSCECVDLRNHGSELRAHFECPHDVFHTWELMLDDMPCVVKARRSVEARHRTVLLDKVFVERDDLNRGYIEARVQTSTNLGIFYTAVMEVVLETSVATTASNACSKRRIKSIEQATCLLPLDLVDDEGNAKRSATGKIASRV